MSANAASPATIADIMRQNGAPGSDFEETVREIESVKAVRFCWHPWMPLPNFGADTFRFNVPYPELPRLTPIPLTTVVRPVIHGKQAAGQFGLIGNVSTFVGQGQSLEGDAAGFGGSVVSGRGALVERVHQKPEQSLRDVLTAWTHVGMTALSALDAADERELELAYALYEGVTGEARDASEADAGRRPPGLVLEDFPSWLERDAPRALEHALRGGVTRNVPVVKAGAVAGYEQRRYALPREAEAAGLKLIAQMADGVTRAVVAATSPENGVLPKTRKHLQMARNGAAEGKTHLDQLDIWLMGQFPSFDMDTDVERAQRVLKDTVAEGNREARGTSEALFALVEQNQQMMTLLAESQRQTAEALSRLAGGKGK